MATEKRNKKAEVYRKARLRDAQEKNEKELKEREEREEREKLDEESGDKKILVEIKPEKKEVEKLVETQKINEKSKRGRKKIFADDREYKTVRIDRKYYNVLKLLSVLDESPYYNKSVPLVIEEVLIKMFRSSNIKEILKRFGKEI